MKFKKGDRVIGRHVGNLMMKGMLGTILDAGNQDSILVEFDEYIAGHNGVGNTTKEDHCWYCDACQLTPIPVKIDIIVSVTVKGSLKKGW